MTASDQAPAGARVKSCLRNQKQNSPSGGFCFLSWQDLKYERHRATKGPQRILRGTHDKKALPKAWGDFIDSIWQFMRFYGMGEILDPAVYGKVKRRNRDYIYCSVEFDEGYKSYYYLSDEDDISVGDYVIVPVGKDNHHSVAEVVNVEYFAEEDVPLSLDRTKHIIRKCTDEDIDVEEDGQE